MQSSASLFGHSLMPVPSYRNCNRLEPLDAERTGQEVKYIIKSLLVLQSLLCQSIYGDHQEVVFLAELDGIGYSSHCAIVVDDLADHSGRRQSCKLCEIDRRFSLSSSFEDVTASTKRKDMAQQRSLADDLFGSSAALIVCARL